MKRLFYIAAASVCLIAVTLFVLYGYNLYLHKLSYGTFTGRVSEEVVGSRVEFQDNDGKTIGLVDFSGKYLILDFWNSGCGICFEKFPVVQEVYDKYKDTDNVALYSIHSRQEKTGETVSTGNGKLLERGYTFPNLSIRIDNPMLKEMGVDGYPTVLVFNPEGRLIFRGHIESVPSYIDELTNR